MPAPSGVRDLHLADLNGDGALDILVARSTGEVAWYANQGGAAPFTTATSIAAVALGSSRVGAADLDGDGDLDVLAASEGDDTVAWCENTDGVGTFGALQVINDQALGVLSACAADIDGDGDVDAVAATPGNSGVVWYENLDGAGTAWTSHVISGASDDIWCVVAADFDGDGDVDVVESGDDTWSSVRWFKNTDGAGTFGAPLVLVSLSASVMRLGVADFDGDGDADLLKSTSYQDHYGYVSSSLSWNEDDASSMSPQGIDSISWVSHAFRSGCASDVDGDGDQDVIAGCYTPGFSSLYWYENEDALGSFGPPQTLWSLWPYCPQLIAGDIDGDGDQDLLRSNLGWMTIDWMRNDLHAAQAVFRNASPNPAVYTTSLPVLGRDLIGRVSFEGTTGHTHAWLAAYGSPLTWALPGGQMLLANIGDPGGELLGRTAAPGPFATFAVGIPNDPALVGYPVTAQGVLFGGAVPFELTNAQDLVLNH